jgi:hypothetical protein
MIILPRLKTYYSFTKLINVVIAIKISLDNLNNFASTEGQSFKIKLLAVDASQAIAV